MKRFATWTSLAAVVVLLSSTDADAFGRRGGRRGCNGNGGGCHGGNGNYGGGHGCHGGHHGGHHGGSGCHGSVHHGGVHHGSGCHGGHHGGMQRAGSYDSQGRFSYYPDQGNYQQGEELRVRPNTNVIGGEVNSTTTGTISFQAPGEAQIWVDGKMINRTGDAWRYTTPSLRTGQRQSYEVKARWNEDGRVVNQTRTVTVEPGGRMTVDFTRPDTTNPTRQPLNDQNRPQKNFDNNN